MAITAGMVKELREMTGAGMMDCKKALAETNGDMDAAVEFLRKNGQAKAEKKAGRIAAEGIVKTVVKDDKVAAIVTNVKCQSALNDLRKIYKLVDAYGAAGYLSFDLGLYRSLDYYTGMLFEVYLPEMGYPVAGGGRYDKMMQRFGLECPATGFAVGVDRVLLALERNGVITNNRTWDVLVAWSEGKLPEAIAKATALRREGRSVKLLTEAADLQGAALAVKEYGCKSLVYVE